MIDTNDNLKREIVRFNISEDWHEFQTEDIHVDIISNESRLAIIKSIPFLIKGISLDDIIEYEVFDKVNFFKSIVKQSKNSTYAIIFHELNRNFISSILNKFKLSGIEYEASRIIGFFSINISGGKDLVILDKIVGDLIDKGKIGIQTNSYRI